MSGLAVTELKFLHPESLKPFGALFLIERNSLTLAQGLETVVFYGTEVNKDVMPLIRFDETIPFSVIKPFNSTFSHVGVPFG
jgi:hypothetical protein